MGRYVPLHEVLVPNVVRVEKADEWCIQFRQATPNGATLPDIRFQPDIAKSGVVQVRKIVANHPVGLIGRSVVDDDNLDVTHRLSRGRANSVPDETRIVVVGDYYSDRGSDRHSCT